MTRFGYRLSSRFSGDSVLSVLGRGGVQSDVRLNPCMNNSLARHNGISWLAHGVFSGDMTSLKLTLYDVTAKVGLLVDHSLETGKALEHRFDGDG